MSTAVVSASRWRANRRLGNRDIFDAFVPGFSQRESPGAATSDGRHIQRHLRSNMTGCNCRAALRPNRVDAGAPST